MFIFKAHRRLAALEERLARLESELRRGVADIEDAYERTRRLHGRITKRAALGAEDAPASPPPEPAPRSSTEFARMLARQGRAVIPGRRANGSNEEA